MKYEGKFAGVDVYSDVDCPPNHVYFIKDILKIPPGLDIHTPEWKESIKHMIVEEKNEIE